jgi:glutathione S-transferase
MYELFIANKNYSSWSLRPWILLKTPGIPFNERLFPFGSGSSYEAFRKFSPTGRVPVLLDGEVKVWDSLAIAEYLAERHAGVWPEDGVARAWARSAAAEMHSGFSTLRDICTMNCGIRVTLKDMPRALAGDIARIGELWAEGLDRFGGPFLAGKSFSAVDAFFAPVVFRVQTYGLTMNPAADAYAQRILALPAMAEWYAAAIAETFREAGHEAEAKAAGTWTKDLRAPEV